MGTAAAETSIPYNDNCGTGLYYAFYTSTNTLCVESKSNDLFGEVSFEKGSSRWSLDGGNGHPKTGRM